MNLEGQSVVVTGKIAGHTRQTAEAELRARGAFVQSSVTRSTTLLVTGEAVGATKMNKAREMGASVRSWAEVVEGEEGSADAGPSTPRAEAKPGMKEPKQVSPQLAKKAEEPPRGDEWVYEVKWDGHRMVAHCTPEGVALRSRAGNPQSYPQIEEDLKAIRSAVLDGEVVGIGDGERMPTMHELGDGRTRSVLIVFDMLEVNGTDMRGWTWRERRGALENLLRMAKLTYVLPAPVFDDPDEVLEMVLRKRGEGIIAKRRSSKYREGSRGEAWRKIKVRREQEFVVIGWTDGENSNVGHVGALALAYYDENEELVYAGKVGTGIGPRDWDQVMTLKAADPPEALVKGDAVDRALARNVHWIEPTMVAQVAFQSTTGGDRLWHPSFQAWRHDKKPSEVRKEW